MKIKGSVSVFCQACCGLALSLNVCFAQAPLTSSGTPAPSLPAAPAVTVTPELRAAIKDLFEATKFREGLKTAYLGFSQTLPQQLAQSINVSMQQNQQLTPEQKKQVGESLSKSFEPAAKEAVAVLQDPKLIDQTVENAYAIYAKSFTLAEIKQINAFYRTPVGAKLLTTMPQVAADSLRSGMALAQPRVAAIMNNLMKKELDAVQKK